MSSALANKSFDQFDWKPQPAAQKLVNELLADFLSRCPRAAELAGLMKSQTGTRFHDWVDFIEAPHSPALANRLRETGFTQQAQPGLPTGDECHVHEGAMFPTIVLAKAGTGSANGHVNGHAAPTSVTGSPEPRGDQAIHVGIKVDSVIDFLATWKLDHPVLDEPMTALRRAKAFGGQQAELWVIERHGYRGFERQAFDPRRALASVKHLEALRKRRRDFGLGYDADKKAFDHAMNLIDAAIKDLGRDWACDLFFQGEREYWQRRCRAARVQKARQDTLGLGWANHDHHTYRSSRRCYKWMIAFLEKLGFYARERFYAGAEAGWGAQVIEQPVAGITIFADVDMSPEELVGDFPHLGLPERDQLGTIGLWCELHGEAFLQAGMHHLECQFDWHALKEQLDKEANVKMMDPFTTFPYLRQAFTEGERWKVSEERLAAVVARKAISADQAQAFRTQGALGSHLENLERNDGFKGFNQGGVSAIIAKTDPRKQVQTAGA